MEGIRGDLPISAWCRREGIHANLYYRWLKGFMGAGKACLKGDETRGATRAEAEVLPGEVIPSRRREVRRRTSEWRRRHMRARGRGALVKGALSAPGWRLTQACDPSTTAGPRGGRAGAPVLPRLSRLRGGPTAVDARLR